MDMRDIMAYYLVPTVWLDAPPIPGNRTQFDLNTEEVMQPFQFSIGIRAKALRGGLFLFDFTGWPGEREQIRKSTEEFSKLLLRQTNIINTQIVCLYTALSQDQQMFPYQGLLATPDTIIQVGSFEDNAPMAIKYPESDEIIGFSMLRDKSSIISIPIVKQSFDILESILNRRDSERIILFSNLLLRGLKAFEEFDYSFCLTTSWTLIEALLQQRWGEYIAANRTRTLNGDNVPFINSDRRERLNDSRTFSVSVISEILSLLEWLPLNLYLEIAKLRKLRNDWVHSLQQVERSDAETSLEIAQTLLNLIGNMDFQVI